MRVLVINGGSSSFKCEIHDLAGEPLPVQPPKPAWEARLDWDERSQVGEVLGPVLASIPGPVDAVGHRIVHGGSAFRESVIVTADVRAAIARQAEVAPSHNRFELEAIGTVDRVLGAGTRQVAVFDTAFHAALAPAAYVYPGPYSWLGEGIRRYGFHGISYQYAARRAAEMLCGDPERLRLIVCHLGNGASVAAVRGGKSVDTTMGFTPLEGLMMGTRCGSIDPGILVYLIRHHGYTADELDRILNHESGLLGVSGLSGDMREIQAAMAQGDSRARLAFDIYVHRVVRETGAMLAVLGGVDALVFTGGVGEHCAPLREALSKQFSFLGGLQILVIPAEEEWEIARECHRLLA